MAKETGFINLVINNISVSWDETARRKEKPCVVCTGLTRGRMATTDGHRRAAHAGCAVKRTLQKALAIYVRPERA